MECAVLGTTVTGCVEVSEQKSPTVAILAERVNNHIRFFWAVVAVGFVWLAGISAALFHMNNAIGAVQIAQADAPARIVASLLSKPEMSREDATAALLATSTILKSSKPGPVKPDSAILKQAAAAIVQSQSKYADLPATWQATGAYINYRSVATLPDPSSVAAARGNTCKASLGAAGWVFEGCELSLEDLTQHLQGNRVNGDLAPFNFIKCIVHYSGGAIPAKELRFMGSLLEFHITTVPAADGILAMRELTISGPDAYIRLS